MSAAEVARLMRGKKFGKTWRARCPVHGSRKGRRDAVSITQMHDGVRVHCFGGCSAADVIKAVGLKWRDLRNEEITPAVRARTSLQEQRENLERQLGLVLWLEALESGQRLSGRSDASCRQFDAALSRLWSTVKCGQKSGK